MHYLRISCAWRNYYSSSKACWVTPRSPYGRWNWSKACLGNVV